jgi:hypothetical protein
MTVCQYSCWAVQEQQHDSISCWDALVLQRRLTAIATTPSDTVGTLVLWHVYFISWNSFHVLYRKIDVNSEVLETFPLLSLSTPCLLCCCACSNSLTVTLYIIRHDSNISHSWGRKTPACSDPDASHFFRHIPSGFCPLSSGIHPLPCPSPFIFIRRLIVYTKTFVTVLECKCIRFE